MAVRKRKAISNDTIYATNIVEFGLPWNSRIKNFILLSFFQAFFENFYDLTLHTLLWELFRNIHIYNNINKNKHKGAQRGTQVYQ